MKIGLISDTHGELPAKILKFLSECDEIWHAGDIGQISVLESLEKQVRIRAVHGNIDSAVLAAKYPEFLFFTCEEVKVLMIHIGGYPKKYSEKALKLMKQYRPDLFISGHSHILKIMYDAEYQLLHMNPGAAGKFGLHRYVTAIRFDIHGKELENAEIFEMEKYLL